MKSTRTIDVAGLLGLMALLLWLVGFATFLLMPAKAWAGEPGRSIWQRAKCEAYGIAASSCVSLKGLVKLHGLSAVKATARKCGASEDQIAARESSCQ